MPNWVENTIRVEGERDVVAEFIRQAGKAPITQHPNQSKPEEFSFGNFIAPPQEAIDSGEYHATNGWEGGERSGDTPNNWYNFNTREWGTKWDASGPIVVDISVGGASVEISFNTAWSPPEPVFIAMAEQYPNLEFEIRWEEEQGFGGELEGTGGELITTATWDIPESHADYADRGREDNCVCAWTDEVEEWYADCGRPTDYEVSVTRTFRVSARTEDEAIKTTEEMVGSQSLIKDEKVVELDDGVVVELVSEITEEMA